MPFTGHAIEKPQRPAALRAYDLVAIFQQAERAWLTLMDSIAAGYSSAWDKQVSVLNDIKTEIQQDSDRACFILSVLTAGIGGGLLGGVASGAVKSVGEGFVQSFVTNAASDGASQLAGSAVSYFQSHGGSGRFESPGLKPWTYAPTMRKNVGLFFSELYSHLGHIIDYLEAANSPLLDGEQWYQYYSHFPGVGKFPSEDDVNDHDFEKEAGLCLWIAWGAERDDSYWNKAWKAAENPPGGNMTLSMEYTRYLIDINRWDPIIDALCEIDPQLEMQVKRGLVCAGNRQTHIDLRTLKKLGIHSKLISANAMSRFLAVPLDLNPQNAKSLLLTMNNPN